MKTFFGGNFIKEDILKEAGINYPIKLEYYKRINEDEILELNKAKFGISIVKTEYKTNKRVVEEKGIKYLTNDERKVNQVLNMLKENFVTPIGLEDVICDYSKQLLTSTGEFYNIF